MVEEGTGALLDFETERPIADAGVAAQVCVLVGFKSYHRAKNTDLTCIQPFTVL